MEALQRFHLRSPINHPKSSRVVPLPPSALLSSLILLPAPSHIQSLSSSPHLLPLLKCAMPHLGVNLVWKQALTQLNGHCKSLDVEIPEKDLEITYSRAAVMEDRTVNKVETVVRIVHIPTGIAVRCTKSMLNHDAFAEEGPQLANRIKALSRLKAKLLVIAEEQRASEITQIRGDAVKAERSQQIRNYVFHPYKLVKDVRTGLETSDIASVMDGELDSFVKSYLKFKYTSSATASSN